MGGLRAAPLQIAKRLVQPAIPVLCCEQLLHHYRQALAVTEAIDLRQVVNQRVIKLTHVCGLLLEQAIEHCPVVSDVIGEVLLRQCRQQVVCVTIHHAVGHADFYRFAAIDMHTGKAQEQPCPARQTIQEPTATHIREQADGDFRHGHARTRGHQTEIRALQQPHAPTHDNAITKHDHRNPAGVDAVIQGVFLGEVLLRERVSALPGMFHHGLVHLHDVTAGAEGLATGPVQPDCHHIITLLPLIHLLAQGLDHFQAQGIEGFGGIQGGAGDQTAAAGFDFGKQHAVRHDNSLGVIRQGWYSG